MKVINKKIQLNKYSTKAFNMYFQNKPFAVFDIETTGLSPKYCKVILSGILMFEGSENFATAIQFFADQENDEELILRKTFELLDTVDYVITYNGRHFDMPFVKTRGEKYGLELPRVFDLDLYQIVASSKSLREVLPGLKQKDVEFYMGLCDSRLDLISGGESVKLYERYMNMKSFELEEKILLHNHDDIIQLYKLLPIIEKTNFHMAMYKKGFTCCNFNIENINLSSGALRIMGKQRKSPVNFLSFPTEEKPYSVILDAKSGDFELIVPCEKVPRALIIDAQTILGEKYHKIEKYPSFENGYLIVSIENDINHMEVNAFIIELINLISSQIISTL